VRIAVISDIHGNFEALASVLADIDSQGVDQVLVGSDLAESGQQPAEVLDFVINHRLPAVVGNADVLLIEVANGMRREKDLVPGAD